MKNNRKILFLPLFVLVLFTFLYISASAAAVIPGDMNGDSLVNVDDAIYLLRHTFKPYDYPINQSDDVNGDGIPGVDDAIYLLRHTFKPEDYPIVSSEHTLTHHAARAATCGQDGNVEYWSCSECGKNFTNAAATTELQNVVIPATGHKLNGQNYANYNINNGSYGVDADAVVVPYWYGYADYTGRLLPIGVKPFAGQSFVCESTDLGYFYCEECGDVVTVNVYYAHNGASVILLEPTCQSAGIRKVDCDNCEYDSLSKDSCDLPVEIKSLPHIYSYELVPTYVDDIAGQLYNLEGTCKGNNCGYCGDVNIFAENIYNVEVNKLKAPNCLEFGETQYIFKQFGYSYTNFMTVKLPKTNHILNGKEVDSYNNGMTTATPGVKAFMNAQFKYAVCESYVDAYFICEYCSTIEGVDSVVGISVQKAHTETDVRIVVPPTCEDPGTKFFICAEENCCYAFGEIIYAEIPALGHSYEYQIEDLCQGMTQSQINDYIKIHGFRYVISMVCTREIDGEGNICGGINEDFAFNGYMYITDVKKGDERKPTCLEDGYVIYTVKIDDSWTQLKFVYPKTNHVLGGAPLESYYGMTTATPGVKPFGGGWDKYSCGYVDAYFVCEYCSTVDGADAIISVTVLKEHSYNYYITEDYEGVLYLKRNCEYCYSIEEIIEELTVNDLTLVNRVEPNRCAAGYITYSYDVDSETTVYYDISIPSEVNHKLNGVHLESYEGLTTSTTGIKAYANLPFDNFDCGEYVSAYFICEYCRNIEYADSVIDVTVIKTHDYDSCEYGIVEYGEILHLEKYCNECGLPEFVRELTINDLTLVNRVEPDHCNSGYIIYNYRVTSSIRVEYRKTLPGGPHTLNGENFDPDKLFPSNTPGVYFFANATPRVCGIQVQGYAYCEFCLLPMHVNIDVVHDFDGTGECTRCGEMLVVHDLTHYEAILATCTEDGNVEYWYCSDCEKYFADEDATTELYDIVIPAAHTGGTEIRDHKEPTNTEYGYTGDTYCLTCGEKITDGRAYKDGYIFIYNISELIDIALDLDGNYILMNDLDLEGKEWTPIGTYESPFTGTFDGNGHVISNYIITQFKSYVGLFGYSTGDFKNLGLKSFRVDVSGGSGFSYAGGLAGYSDGDITNCYATGNIMAQSGTYVFVGGLVAKNNTGTITNCYAKGDMVVLNSGFAYAGGLIAKNERGDIINCYATGNVTANSEDHNHAGGLIGNTYNGNIINCYATGDIWSDSSCISEYTYSYAGGVVGRYDYGLITNCYRYSGQSITVINDNGYIYNADGYVTAIDIATLESVDFHTDTLGWSEDNWYFVEGKNPTLKKAVVHSHSFTHYESVPATCTEDGNVEYWYCTDCEKYFADGEATTELDSVLILAGHTEVIDAAVVATCIETGLTEGSHCSSCGEVFEEQVVYIEKHSTVDHVCTVCGLDFSDATLYNGNYGYEYLGTLENGSNLQGFYLALDEVASKFHNDTSISISENEMQTNGNGEKFGYLESVSYGDYDLTLDEALMVAYTLTSDRPVYYWYGGNYGYSTTAKLFLLSTMEEYANGADRAATHDRIYDAIEEYTYIVATESSAYNIALGYHDAIINAIDYAYDDEGYPVSEEWAHSIIGVFDKLGAVCEGYAETLSSLLNFSGVENAYYSGAPAVGAGHAWNIVRLDDGNWYWIDATWGDQPVPENLDWSTSIWPHPQGISHNYFCVNDTQPVDQFDGMDDGVWEKNFMTDHAKYESRYDVTYPERSNVVFDDADVLELRETFTIDGYTYALIGYGKVQLVSVDETRNIVVPESVVYNNIAYDVIAIGALDENGLFDYSKPIAGNGALKITIPESVTFVWHYALNNILDVVWLAEN